MTSYSSLVRDFPMRCRDILADYEEEARGKNQEVTLLIAIATSAFTIPFERLNPSASDHVADDRFPEAVSKLGKLQNLGFVAWQTGATWKIIEGLESRQIKASQADAWARPESWQSIPTSKKVGSVLSIIRNALAHGCIFTFPRPSSEKLVQIEDIVFLPHMRKDKTRIGWMAWILARFSHGYQTASTKFTDKYIALKVSPADFRTLILDWISFLEGLPLPSVIRQENI